jgi:WD40 repeat protein/tRNA A-37 threonylcarbamoyl transferase component Bud32
MLAGALEPSSEEEIPGEDVPVGSEPDVGTASATAGGVATRCFGAYELITELGRGGMGVVYKARQRGLKRFVALKMIQAQRLASAAMVQRFRLEAEAAASLRHPNIVATHDVGEHAGQHFFSMDFIAGRSLAEVISDFRVPSSEFRRAAGWMQKIAQAIHHAHQHGILHRDLKPSNILVDSNDEPHVTDFGLARRLEAESTLTLTGEVLGSPAYMAPEQAAGSRRQVTVAADIYSLGCILFELLAGRPPFREATPAETLHQVLHAEPARPRLLNPAAPRDLETICLKCLEKEPLRRYGSAQEVADELGRFLRDEPIQARPAGRAEKLGRWARRNPVVAGLSAISLFLVLVVAVGSPIALWKIEKARSIAEARSYAADMNLVQQALALNNVGRAERLLNRYRPARKSEILAQSEKESGMGRRGWEWRYLWKQCQSDALCALCWKSNSIISLAVSYDGKWLAVGEKSHGALSVWDLQTRREVTRLPAGENAVHVAFSPRETLLAFSVETGLESTTRRGSVRLWDGRVGKVIAELPLGGWCRGLAFSEEGQTLLTSTLPPNNQFILWKVPEGKKLASYPAARTVSSGVRFAATRELGLAAHAVGERIRVVNLTSGQVQWTAAVEDEKVSTLTFSPDGKMLATGADAVEPAIRLWDAASGKDLGRLRGHSAYIFDVLFWPDGKTLASASADQTIRLWDLTHMRPLHTLRGHRHELWRLALHPDQKTLVSGCKDGSVCLWDTTVVPSERIVFTLPVVVRAWRFAPDSQSVLTIDRKGSVTRWQGAEFQHAQPLLELGPRILGMCFSPDGHLIAGGYTNGMIRVWDLQRQSLLREIQAAQRPVRPWQFFAQGTTVAVATEGTDTYHEWDVSTGQEKRSWRGAQNWTHGALSPDGGWCFTRGLSGVASLNDLQTGREINLSLNAIQVWNGAFSPDSKFFAVASSLGFCKLWETDTFQEVATLGGFLQGVHSVVFSPDGKRLAAGSNLKEAIKIWDMESQQELLTLQGQGARFSSCAFSPDGNVLGALNSAGVLHLWRAPSWQQVADVQP